jgi:hypothetical protein
LKGADQGDVLEVARVSPNRIDELVRARATEVSNAKPASPSRGSGDFAGFHGWVSPALSSSRTCATSAAMVFRSSAVKLEDCTTISRCAAKGRLPSSPPSLAAVSNLGLTEIEMDGA